MDDVRFAILCSRFGYRPNLLRQVELFPREAGNFVASLPGKRQKLDNRTIRTTHLSSGKDDLGELAVAEHAVSSHLLRRQGHAFRRRLVQHRSTHAPAQERFERLQGLVGGTRSAALGDRRDDLNNVSLTDRMNASARPRLSYLSPEDSCDLCAVTVL